MKEMEGAADVLMVADPDDVPRAAVGAEHRLAAVRSAFRRRQAGAVRDAQSISRRCSISSPSAATTSSPASRSNSTSSSWKIAKMSPEHAGQPGTPPDGQPAVARLPVSDRAALRPDGAGAGNHPARRRWRSACRCARSRSSSGRASANSPFAPTTGLEPADTMVLFRSAVKQIARRHGYHATFMCRPRIPNVFVVGLAPAPVAGVDRQDGDNAFMADDGGEALLPVRPPLSRRPAAACPRLHRVHDADHQRLQALPLLLAGAGPRDLGPRQPRRDDPRARRRRATPRRGWRTASASPPPTPISTWPRRFSPASTASTARLDPGPSADTPYETKAELLPKTLREAVVALRDDPFFRDALGAEFVDYYVHIKNAEIERFQAEVIGLGAARIFRDVLKASEPPRLPLTAR